MYSKIGLTIEELLAILDGVWEYSRQGQVGRLEFFSPDGERVQVAHVEVWSGAPTIRVRSAPEEDTPMQTPEEIAAMAVLHRLANAADLPGASRG